MKTSLASVTGAEAVDLLATVASEDTVASPLTSARAAVVVVDVFERAALLEREVGRVVLGDTLVLGTDGGELVIVARRARFSFVGDDPSAGEGVAAGAGSGGLLERAPAELAFLLARATGAGPLVWREHLVRRGASVRIQAVVAPSGAPDARRFVACDDRGPVLVSEPLGV